MTSCSECLNALSSARVTDIAPGSAIALHCATCPQCMRVADEVRYAEYRLAASLNEERPGRPSDEVAIAAIDGSEFQRRRRIGRWVTGALALIALGLFGAAMEARLEDENRPKLVTETMSLRCLTAKQAAELVTPYLRGSGSAVYHSDNLRTITIQGNNDELAGATIAVRSLDDAASCATSPAIATVAGTPVALDPDIALLEFQVDKPAAQIAGTGTPIYPAELRAAGIEGELQAQFVVTEAGNVEVGTFKVMKTTNDLFPRAVRAALPEMRFQPAEAKGRKVKQLVQQSFKFMLDKETIR